MLRSTQTLQLARRIRQIPPSATLALNTKANQLKAQGILLRKNWEAGLLNY